MPPDGTTVLLGLFAMLYAGGLAGIYTIIFLSSQKHRKAK